MLDAVKRVVDNNFLSFSNTVQRRVHFAFNAV